MKLRLSSTACTFAASCAIAITAHAAPYTFETIVDSTGPFRVFGVPSLNSNGTIAFSATPYSGPQGVFSSNGGTITTIADAGGVFFTFSPGVSINDSGMVSSYALLDGGDTIVFKGDGGPITRISEPTKPSFVGAETSINNGGTVAYTVFEDSINFERALLTSGGGSPTTIADTNGPFSHINYASINDTGMVSFTATLDGFTGNGVYTGNGGPLTTIAETNGMFQSLSQSSMNNNGTVAFQGFSWSGEEGLFTGDGGPVTKLADTSGPFSLFGVGLSINDSSEVAFVAELDSGVSGIFSGPDPGSDTVIAIGDMLNGSEIIGLELGYSAINDAAQIAFWASLADGTQGLYVASPIPLPPAVWLFASGLLGLIGISRRKKAA